MLSYTSLTSYHSSGHHIEVYEPDLKDIISILLEYIEVDEVWYRERNPDVDAAINNGTLKSAKDHYLLAGYFENRLPHPVDVDEQWYFEMYKDVAEEVVSGRIASAADHFMTFGFKEGRLPSPNWSLLRGSTLLRKVD